MSSFTNWPGGRLFNNTGRPFIVEWKRFSIAVVGEKVDALAGKQRQGVAQFEQLLVGFRRKQYV